MDASMQQATVNSLRLNYAAQRHVNAHALFYTISSSSMNFMHIHFFNIRLILTPPLHHGSKRPFENTILLAVLISANKAI